MRDVTVKHVRLSREHEWQSLTYEKNEEDVEGWKKGHSKQQLDTRAAQPDDRTDATHLATDQTCS